LKRTFAILLGLLFVVVLAGILFLGGAGPDPRHVVFHGGPILTMNAENAVVEALSMQDGRILAVGQAKALIAEGEARGAEIVDLAGRALLPGFIDAHGHYPGEGLTAVFADLNSPPIGTVTKVDVAIQTLAEQASSLDAGEWVIGTGYDDTLVDERRLLTRHDLDRVSAEHPVAVLHISGHLAVLNSQALELVGIDADTPDPVGGVIRREADGRTPDGVLEESAMEVVGARLLPPLSRTLELFAAATDLALANGVTTVQSGATPVGLIRALDWMSWLGVVPLRLTVYPDWSAAQASMAGEFELPDGEPERLDIGPVKLIADGSIQGYTGYLSQPYHVPPGADPEFRGYPRILRDDLFERVSRLQAAGFQIAVHGNGDASIDDILDAFAAASAEFPREDARPIIIHAQMTRADQLDRMRTLGVVPSFFSLHTFYWGDRHRALFMGPERAAGMSPAQSALERGVRFTIHCDAPIVPMEPLRLVWSAVNRKTRSGFVVGPDERLSVMDALRAVTIDAAYQHFQEDSRGSLEVGKLADLVILSGSPLADPEHIDSLQVDETILGGVTLFRRGAE
jgi:predicted amidohydrolase YtcJ